MIDALFYFYPLYRNYSKGDSFTDKFIVIISLLEKPSRISTNKRFRKTFSKILQILDYAWI